MTAMKPRRGLFGLLSRPRADHLSDRQLADIIPDSDPRLRGRLARDAYPNQLADFLLFGGPRSR